METYQASLKQKIVCHWIMFWQRFGFYPNHLVMNDYFIGIINEETKWNKKTLEQATADLKATCQSIKKRSKSWEKQNKQIKKNLEKTNKLLKSL